MCTYIYIYIYIELVSNSHESSGSLGSLGPVKRDAGKKGLGVTI